MGRARRGRAGPDMDGPYMCSHAALGVQTTIWKVQQDSGGQRSNGVPEDMNQGAAEKMVSALGNTRQTAMRQ